MDEQKSINPVQSPNTQNPPSETLPVFASPVSPPISPKPKKVILKKLFIWMIIIILILFAGWYYFIFSKISNNSPSLAYKQNEASQVNTIKNITIPSGWKTYTNKSYGYTFSYPPTWNIEGDPRYTDVENLSDLEMDTQCDIKKDTYCTSFSVDISDYNPQLGLKGGREFENVQTQSIKQFNGYQALEIRSLDTRNMAGNNYYDLMVLKSNKIYHISFSNELTKENSEPPKSLFNQSTLESILNSFKFTNTPLISPAAIQTFFEYQPSELKGFPLYPGAQFIQKQIIPKSDISGSTGFSVANANTYEFVSGVDGNTLLNNYLQEATKEGWECQGGGGSYTSSRDLFAAPTCQKDSQLVQLFVTATASATTVKIAIPNY